METVQMNSHVTGSHILAVLNSILGDVEKVRFKPVHRFDADLQTTFVPGIGCNLFHTVNRPVPFILCSGFSCPVSPRSVVHPTQYGRAEVIVDVYRSFHTLNTFLSHLRLG